MSPSRIISPYQIQTLAGYSASMSPALIDVWADTASEILASLLDVTNVARHAVVDEKVVPGPDYFLLADMPVDASTVTLKDADSYAITGYTFRRDTRLTRKVHTLYADSRRQVITYESLIVSYTAGYRAQTQLTVASIASLNDKTFTVNHRGTSTAYTFKTSLTTPAVATEILIGGTAAATATNIAAKLSGSTVADAVITLEHGDAYSAGTTPSANVASLDADIPSALVLAAALIAGGGIAEQQKKGGVVSYSLGTKSVSFASSGDAVTAMQIVKNWAGKFKKFGINA